MKIELYGVLAEAAGAPTLELEGPPAATAGEAIERLRRLQPRLTAYLERSACAVGDRLVRRGEPLPADATLVLLPPVSGG